MSEERRRVQRMMNRELDGELTALERSELERELRAHPDLRRERARWRQVTDVLSQDTPGAAPIYGPGLERAVLDRVQARSPIREALRWTKLVAGTALAGLGLWVVTQSPLTSRDPGTMALGSEPPVSVEVGAPAPDDGDPKLVTVTF